MNSPDQQGTQNTSTISNNLWTRLSLQTKTLYILLTVALIPVIGQAIYNTYQTQKALTNAAEISLKANAAQTAASLDAFIKSTLDSVRVEAQSVDLVAYLTLSPNQRSGSEEETQTLTFLRNLDRKDPINILGYAIIDSQGKNVLDVVSSNIGTSEANTKYYLNVLESELPYSSGVVYQGDSERVLYFASPIRNAAGQIIGIIRAEYSAGILQQFANTNALAAGASTTVILLDDYHIRLAETSDIELIQKSIVPLNDEVFSTAVSEGRLLSNIPATDQATNNQDFEIALNNAGSDSFFEADLYANEPGIDSIAIAQMANQPWIVAASQPRSLLLQDVQSQTIISLLILIGIALVVAVVAIYTSRNLTSPLIALTKTAESVASGNLQSRALVQTQDEIGVLAVTFNAMADQLNQTLLGLEQRVEERTRDLSKRSEQLEAIADVARSVATIQEVDQLLTTITEQVSERFGFYHVGIFLINANQQYANLRAANSEGGKTMLARDHRLKVGEQGIVGFVTFRGQARVALDVGEEAVFFNNPDLPETHSEVALPLKFGQQIIGALDIQSKETNAFSQDDVNIFSILADQVSVAIQNTRSLEQAQRALHEAEVASSQLIGQAWKGYAEKAGAKGYRYDGVKSEQLTEPGRASEEKDVLLVPVQLRGQTIGRLKLRSSESNRKWTEDERAIIESTADRVALAMEGARLLDEAQKRAARESFLAEVGTKLGASFQMDSILRDTVEELGQTLKGSTVSFQLVNPSAPPSEFDLPEKSARRKKSE